MRKLSVAEPETAPRVQSGAGAQEYQMRKFFVIMAVATVAAAATTATATARSHHYYHHHHGWMLGFRGSNAELRGNNGNSASGPNSLANPNNAVGVGSGR
jgi:hypothetical protein